MRWRLFEKKPEHRGTYVLEPGRTSESRLRVNLNGVRWDRAHIPPRMHRCWPQTKHLDRNKPISMRCACGAWSLTGRYWVNRNSRRKSLVRLRQGHYPW